MCVCMYVCYTLDKRQMMIAIKSKGFRLIFTKADLVWKYFPTFPFVNKNGQKQGF